ncbi:hypothetical protein ENHAE0001_1731 [Enhydrobacter aerosaccus SK60]|nr:hypothetical protein ENHAE0001_1731 [Enhydrobacter aerosaccus SK60]
MTMELLDNLLPQAKIIGLFCIFNETVLKDRVSGFYGRIFCVKWRRS